MLARPKFDRVLVLSQLAGVTVAESELAEVSDRCESLLSAMDELAFLDLAAVEPITIFPDESDNAA